MASVKMVGNIIELNSPIAITDQSATWPSLNPVTNRRATTIKAKSASVRAGFDLQIINAMAFPTTSPRMVSAMETLPVRR